MAHYARIKLPRNHHKEDAKWLESQLTILRPQHQIQARAAYSDIYSTAYSNESISHKKLNSARREANIRMRKFVDACLGSYAEECVNQSQVTSTSQSNFSIDDL